MFLPKTSTKSNLSLFSNHWSWYSIISSIASSSLESLKFLYLNSAISSIVPPLSAKCSPFNLPIGASVTVMYFKPVNDLKPSAALVCNCNMRIKLASDILLFTNFFIRYLNNILLLVLASFISFSNLASSAFLPSTFRLLKSNFLPFLLFNILSILSNKPPFILTFIGLTLLRSNSNGKSALELTRLDFMFSNLL